MANKSKYCGLILSFLGSALIIASLFFIAGTAKAQNLPSYNQVINSLPAPVSNFTNTVKQTIDKTQTPSAQNIDTKGLMSEITAAFNWLGAQFKDLTGVSFSSLASTVINFLIWLIKLVIGIVVGIVNLVSSLLKK